MLCGPAERVEVLKVATPPLIGTPCAILVLPSKKSTVPVAELLLIVAVKVTLAW